MASNKGGKEKQMLMSFVYFEEARKVLLSYGSVVYKKSRNPENPEKNLPEQGK